MAMTFLETNEKQHFEKCQRQNAKKQSEDEQVQGQRTDETDRADAEGFVGSNERETFAEKPPGGSASPELLDLHFKFEQVGPCKADESDGYSVPCLGVAPCEEAHRGTAPHRGEEQQVAKSMPP